MTPIWQRLAAAPLTALLLGGPTAALAATQTFHCALSHYVRSNGTEMVSGSLAVRNADGVHPATILRLTIRDSDGVVLHDSGPALGTALPLNTDFPVSAPTGKDITRVPSSGSVYLRTGHLWGNNPLPAGNEVGQQLAATLVVAKDGNKGALTATSTQRMRTRAAGGTPGSFVELDTRATNTLPCTTP